VTQPQETSAPSGDGSGDPRVDAALARLDGVTDLPGTEQVATYEAVHRTLQDTLATIDEG
jgi:hypothetical protein